MPPVTDRWYVSGALGVGTAFDESTDAQSALSVVWKDAVGCAFRHPGAEALNLLDSRPASAGFGPNLNFWALNGGSPPKAVRLASMASKLATIADGSASGSLSFSTKPANGDLAEA